jgi:hypothetical protein
VRHIHPREVSSSTSVVAPRRNPSKQAEKSVEQSRQKPNRMLGGRRSRFLVDFSHRLSLLNNSLEVCRHSNRTGIESETQRGAGRDVETFLHRFQAKPDEDGGSKSPPLPADQYKHMSIFGL